MWIWLFINHHSYSYRCFSKATILYCAHAWECHMMNTAWYSLCFLLGMLCNEYQVGNKYNTSCYCVWIIMQPNKAYCIVFQPSRLSLMSATLLLSQAINHQTTGQHHLSLWHAELWVPLVEYDTAGLQHVVEIIVLCRTEVIMSIAMVQLPEVVIFCAITMLEPTIARPMTAARGLVAVPLLWWKL